LAALSGCGPGESCSLSIGNRGNRPIWSALTWRLVIFLNSSIASLRGFWLILRSNSQGGPAHRATLCGRSKGQGIEVTRRPTSGLAANPFSPAFAGGHQTPRLTRFLYVTARRLWPGCWVGRTPAPGPWEVPISAFQRGWPLRFLTAGAAKFAGSFAGTTGHPWNNLCAASS